MATSQIKRKNAVMKTVEVCALSAASDARNAKVNGEVNPFLTLRKRIKNKMTEAEIDAQLQAIRAEW